MKVDYHHKGSYNLFVNLISIFNPAFTPDVQFLAQEKTTTACVLCQAPFFIGTDNQLISIVAIWFCDQSNSFSLSKPQI